MNTTIGIARALLSVSDKTGILDLARSLAANGVEILSTGGTRKYLAENGIKVTDVSDVTGFPEIMDGRVKTLHPKIHGGLLSIRNDSGHRQAQSEHGIDNIDLLVVNLYPFRETVARGADFADCIENIDIGGPAMIRAAAKNHAFVTVVTDPQDYADITAELPGGIAPETRRRLAAKAFAATASYDAAIAGWFSRELDDVFPQTLSLPAVRLSALRYGENPHQIAALYGDGSMRAGAALAVQIQGKELSFNNLNDTDAAYELVAEFGTPAVAIIKHANPCGVASGDTTIEAYKHALACDPVSAFGGIIALNRPLDAETAREIIMIFSEVIIAPSIDDEARAILASKPNLRVLEAGGLPDAQALRMNIRTVSGGYLVQTSDHGRIGETELEVVTKRAPNPDEIADLLFAFRVAKHVKSNAIVYARDGRTLGIGAGQMSRIDSTRIAAWKAGEAKLDLKNSVVASDAFFPFADGLIAAAEAGASAVIQPGGSIRDKDVIEAADARGLAMVFTRMRHFRH